MYAAVRRYEGITDPAEVGRSRRRELSASPRTRLRLRRRNYWIDAGDGAMASLSVFEDKEGIDKPVEIAYNWVPDLVSQFPEPVSGDLVV